MLNFDSSFLEENDKLVCLGDSLTAAENAYMDILKAKLNKNTVINAGVGGDKTVNALVRFEKDVLSQKPDALFIFLGTNDAVIGKGRWADEPTISPEAYRDNLIWICYLAKQNKINKLSICTPAAFCEGEALFDSGDCLGDYCLAARTAADRMQVRLVPFDSAFRTEWRKNTDNEAMFLTRDGVHLNEKGNMLLANTILNAWKMNGC